MSKKQYTETFSKLHPSDESIERIMSMTNKKYVVGVRKTLIIAAVVISILCSVGLAANAATDGAVADSVSKAFENVSKKITVMVNGEEKEADVTVTQKTGSNGEELYEAEVKINTDPDKPFEVNTNEISFQLSDFMKKETGYDMECEYSYIFTAIKDETVLTAKEK